MENNNKDSHIKEKLIFCDHVKNPVNIRAEYNKEDYENDQIKTFEYEFDCKFKREHEEECKDVEFCNVYNSDVMDHYWKYYKLLEEKFIHMKKYIDFHTDNYNVFSFDLLELYLSIGSELDVLFKELCGFATSDRKSIYDYRTWIDSVPPLRDAMIQVMHFQDSIQPFLKYDGDSNYLWWKHYNLVKHNRAMNMNLANMQNVMYSLAALYLTELYINQKYTRRTSFLDGEISAIFTGNFDFGLCMTLLKAEIN